MFTGIVQAFGVIVSIEKGRGRITMKIRPPKSFGRPGAGASVAVNGCCLTVARRAGGLGFDLLEETWKKTAFADAGAGERVNLERPLKHGQEVGGHFVLGHVDGVGKIVRARSKGSDREVTIRAPAALMRYIVYKGSIAVDGVSLTVARVSGNTFTVWIIPHTAQLTTLGWKRPGQRVNLEADLILKFAEKNLRK